MILARPLSTTNLSLRMLHPDAAAGPYLDWLRDPQVTRYLEVRFTHQDEHSLRAFIGRANASEDTLLLGIHLGPREQHIGNIKLGPIHVPHRRADIGLLIGVRSEWGKGYAREAIHALKEYAFGVLDLHKLTASCYEPNVASARAFTSAGFAVEGTRPGQYYCDGHWVGQILLGCMREPEREVRRTDH